MVFCFAGDPTKPNNRRTSIEFGDAAEDGKVTSAPAAFQIEVASDGRRVGHRRDGGGEWCAVAAVELAR
jgi:hypothetical protein